MKIRFSVLVPSLVALVVAAGCGPSPAATISPTPKPPAVFDDGFGFLVGNAVRRESDPESLFVLGIPSDAGGVLSPDGRRLAYWAKTDLRVISVASGAQPKSVLSITAKGEAALYFAWSSDSTGLVVGVNGGGGGQADAPPGYTALRVVDAAGGQPREIARVHNANVVPLAWDRQAHIITGYQPSGIGAVAYYTVDESGAVKTTAAGPGIFIVEASHDGTQVSGRGDPNSVVRVWPRASYVDGVELRAAGDEHILATAWRPGTPEIGVLFHDRLEIWDASGARRTISLPAASGATSDRFSSLVFRADGKAVFIGRELEDGTDIYAVAVDLVTGKSVVAKMVGAPLLPGTSVRLGG